VAQHTATSRTGAAAAAAPAVKHTAAYSTRQHACATLHIA
jgi:hypothetical protein